MGPCFASAAEVVVGSVCRESGEAVAPVTVHTVMAGTHVPEREARRQAAQMVIQLAAEETRSVPRSRASPEHPSLIGSCPSELSVRRARRRYQASIRAVAVPVRTGVSS